MAVDDGVANWSALPDDLINKISDNFLSMGDLDYYANFRAVCGGWRRATAEPPFMSSNWINLQHTMSEEYLIDEANITLLNVNTGRFVQKKIPKLIRMFFFVIYILNSCISAILLSLLFNLLLPVWSNLFLLE